jgi:hypothetical protein
MLKRLLISIASIAAIVLAPYWLGHWEWLVKDPFTFEPIVLYYWLNGLVTLSISAMVCYVIYGVFEMARDGIRWIINGNKTDI